MSTRSLILLSILALGLSLAPVVDGQSDLESCASPASEIEDLSTLIETQSISDEYTIGELEVELDITHSFVGSLDVRLETPGGTNVRLIHNIGYALDDVRVTFSDLGIRHTDELDCECSMQPRGPGHMADALGESTAGDWTLTIEDQRSGDTGTLNEWCIRVNEEEPIYPVQDLRAAPSSEEGVALVGWSQPTAYDEIDVFINGVFEETLVGPFTGGGESDYTTPVLTVPQAPAEICLTPRVGTTDGPSNCITVQLPEHRDVFVCNEEPLNFETPGFLSAELSSGLEIDEETFIEDVEVLVEATIPFNGLAIDVESPAGTTVTLKNYGVANDDMRVIYAHDGGAPGSAALNASARLQPDGPGLLTDFIGEATVGEWNLVVRGYSHGVFDNWCLNVDACAIERPTDLTCAASGDDIELTWSNEEGYGSIEVFANGELLATLAEDATSYLHATPEAGRHVYHLVVYSESLDCSLPTDSCLTSIGITDMCALSTPMDYSWPTGRTSITIDESETVGDYIDAYVSMSFDEESERVDLRVTSPSGTTVVLHDNVAGSRHLDTIFTDTGDPNDGSNSKLAQLNSVQPSGPGALSDFVGENVLGDWTLEIESNYSGILEEWCLGWATNCETGSPSGLSCSVSDFEVELTWINEANYDRIEVVRNHVVVATLDGTADDYVDLILSGTYEYRVVGFDSDCGISTPVCTADVGLTEVCDSADAAISGSLEEIDVTVNFGDSTSIHDFEVDLTYSERVVTSRLTSPEGTEVELVAVEARWVDAIFSNHANLDAIETRDHYDCQGCRVQPAPGSSLEDLVGEDAEGDWVVTTTSFVANTLEDLCLRVYETSPLDAPGDFTCAATDDGVELTWTNEASYDEIRVYRVEDVRGAEVHLARDLPAAALLAVLAGDESTFVDTKAAPGWYRYFVQAVDERAAELAVASQCRHIVGRVDSCDTTATEIVGDVTVHDFSVAFPESENLTILDTEVVVDMTIAFTDVVLELESPIGTEVTLHQYDGGETNLHATYSDAGRSVESIKHYDCDGCRVQPKYGSMSDFSGELADGVWDLRVQSFYDATLNTWCVGVYPEEQIAATFRRGDVDGNGTVAALLDGLALLEYGFVGGDAPTCMDAADVDDNGAVMPLLDALFLLEWMFLGADTPPDPGVATCGVDPTDDSIDCTGGPCDP